MWHVPKISVFCCLEAKLLLLFEFVSKYSMKVKWNLSHFNQIISIKLISLSQACFISFVSLFLQIACSQCMWSIEDLSIRPSPFLFPPFKKKGENKRPYFFDYFMVLVVICSGIGNLWLKKNWVYAIDFCLRTHCQTFSFNLNFADFKLTLLYFWQFNFLCFDVYSFFFF